MINDYNKELKDLKGELQNMKNVIAHTFEDELKTGGHLQANKSQISRMGRWISNDLFFFKYSINKLKIARSFFFNF